ncbi:dihydroxyacetone kinase subunit DhaK [Devosia naphthalenivorans]|uniref:dihydroxyacetone kinase subunit DhaK n=1 Tax=Devosia naphthalenivorans TaxID=2082392 RepID=UPI000D377751|nr:dihydroxyacetone kinase subunit DhaK [Devosia naphthalenivorans]
MKKIINDPARFVDDTIEGILLAHPDWLSPAGNNRSLIRKSGVPKGQVGIATGGGSGHLPVFLGYVGEGLAHGVAVGNAFASPSARQMLAVTRGVNAGAGVLHLFGNYQGDSLHFEMAAEMAESDGIRVVAVKASDDIASAPPAEWQSRRGVAGIFFAYKLAGARAAEGADLDAVAETAHYAVANTRTLGVALDACTLPEIGHPNFSFADDEMEIGMGIHGEPGLERRTLMRAEDLAATLVDRILADLPFANGDEVAVLVNGLGSTPVEELYILYRSVAPLLAERGIAVHRTYIGEYATSLDMVGASVSVLKLDADSRRLLDAPARSPFFQQSGAGR